MERGTVTINRSTAARWDEDHEEYAVRTLLERGDGGHLIGLIRWSTTGPGPWSAYRFTEGDADRWSPRKYLGNYSSPTAAATAIAR